MGLEAPCKINIYYKLDSWIKIIITTTFKNEPITIMTTEEAAEVARLGSDIKSFAPT